MLRKPLIFLSSTSDLSDERQALADDVAIRRCFDVYLFEEDRASGVSPKEHCRNMIEKSHVFLGLIGPTYGSTMPDQNDKSIVEWEYETATTVDDLEIMFFLKEEMKTGQLDSRQKSFFGRLTSFDRGRWCRFFKSRNQLVNQVKTSLMQWLSEFFMEMRQSRISISRRLRMPMIFLVVSSLLVFSGIVFSQLSYALLPNWAMIGICCVQAVLILGPLLILHIVGVRDER